ncbi:MAG TPA: carbon-nitrogen hydrolase family protein [Candidatus Dormibacteraeota bacterium]|nr:carbon-nitrogen hydrolase family protein [Candidatus Dormibacteraeota bacterium]
MRIALAQFAAGPAKETNLRRMLDLTADAARAGASIVLFPECSMARLPPELTLEPVAEPVDGPFVSALAEAARRHQLTVVAGVYESIQGDDHVFNTVVALDAEGARLGVYRKVHLFDAFGYRESDRMRPGDGRTLLFSMGATVFGVETCYDVRFPELSRHLAVSGAEVILLPAAWVHGPLKESHWEVLVRARAIENTVYVAAAGLVGRPHSGYSMLVDPMGVPVVRAGEVEALVVGEIDLQRLQAVRRVNPSLEHARPKIYARWRPVVTA